MSGHSVELRGGLVGGEELWLSELLEGRSVRLAWLGVGSCGGKAREGVVEKRDS